MAEPFYGVEGNLLVEDLQHDHETVEKILNGTFKAPSSGPRSSSRGCSGLKYPQLADEYHKREPQIVPGKKTMKAKRELNGRWTVLALVPTLPTTRAGLEHVGEPQPACCLRYMRR